MLFAVRSLSLFFPSSAPATLTPRCSQPVSFLLLECSTEVATFFFISAVTIHRASLESVSIWMFSYLDDPVQVLVNFEIALE